MPVIHYFSVILVALFFVQSACQDSEFKAAGRRSADASPTVSPTPFTTPTPTGLPEEPIVQATPTPDPGETGGGEDSNEECVDGDFIHLTYPPEIDACMKQGKIWSFDNNQCSTIDEAPFTCNVANVEKAWTDAQGDPNKLTEFKLKEAKLVGCGQKIANINGHQITTVIAQWYIPSKQEQTNCEYSTSMGGVYAMCTKMEMLPSQSATPITTDPSTLSEAEMRQWVIDCAMGN